MRTGVTFVEILLASVVLGLMAAIAVPRVRQTADRMAVRRAALEVVAFHREARALAIRRAAPVHLQFAGDSLVAVLGLETVIRRPGPSALGVALTVSREQVTFSPAGLGLGPANTRLTLRRGQIVDEYVTSRLGRLRRSQ